MNRTGKIVSAALAAAAVAAAIGFGREYLLGPSPAAIDRGIQATMELPLVGVVVADHPDLKPRLRQAVIDELEHPSQVPSPGVALGREIRQRYIAPALLGADDDTALKAIDGMSALARHLQAKDVALCREFGMVGLQNPRTLDGDGRVVLKQALAAQEQAYRNGKAGPPKEALKTEDIGTALVEAGYSKDDLAQLGKFATLSTAEACDATVKLYAAPRALPAARGGKMARWLLTISQ